MRAGIVLLADQQCIDRSNVFQRRGRRATGEDGHEHDGEMKAHASILRGAPGRCPAAAHVVSRMFSHALHTAGTLLLALAAALLCAWLRTPLPWMIGPLLATSFASLFGAPTRSWPPLRNAAQWLIATSLGLYFTPQVTALVASLWWAIVLAIAWALALGWGFGRWLHARHAQRIGGAPGTAWATT